MSYIRDYPMLESHKNHRTQRPFITFATAVLGSLEARR